MNTAFRRSPNPDDSLETGPASRTDPDGPSLRAEYHRGFRNYPHPVTRGIGAILVLITGFFAISIAVGAAGRITEVALYGQNVALAGGARYTPITFIAMFGAPALLLPWTALVQRWFYRLPWSALFSVSLAFRPAIIGRSVMYVLPVWAIYFALANALFPLTKSEPMPPSELAVIFAAVFVITPFQAAGEEFAFRGIVFRAMGGWSRSPRAGLIIGVTGSSLAFGLLHGTTDPWLFIHFSGFGVAMSLLTWLTGGLECAIAVHAINNTVTALGTLVLVQYLAVPDPSNGAGGPFVLIPIALLAIIVAVVWKATRGPRVSHEQPQRAPAIA